MTIQKTKSIEYCSILINCSQLVLRLSHNEIKESYSDNPMYVKEYIVKGICENIIDILFDDEGATLSCTFEENNTCNTSYIFFDDLDEVGNYVSYLNNKFTYDYIQNCWILPESFLSIERTNDDIYFKSFC